MKLGKNELEYIQFFEGVTNARVKDCVINEENVIIIVEQGNMGPAIGKKGENIKKIKNKTNKDVSVVEYAPEPKKFIQNLFAPAKLDEIEIKDSQAIILTKERKRVIGQKGTRIKRARTLMKRYFEIQDIIIR
ncbi:NusA-like transcription termination signal-binding factor [archaeon]|nr:NusA-like transcription termination signal-binding factor [archaeon]